MKQRQLRPIRLKSNYIDAIEAEIKRLLKREMYLPLIRETGEDARALKNSLSDLIDAIRAGTIQYTNGRFEGAFSAATSRELKRMGAVWDKTNRAWQIAYSDLSPDVRIALGEALRRFHEMAARVNKRLDGIKPEEMAEKLRLQDIYDTTLFRLNQDFEDSVRALEIKVEFTPEQRRRLAAEYAENMKLYVQDWTRDEIIKLRQAVTKHSFSSMKRESLVKTIQESFGESQNKAKFLARQETNLLSAKFKQTRYQESGVDEYRWQCVVGSPAHPVRPMHKALDGKIFRWDSPPIVDEHGNRKHPQQDYNCRCVARPIVRF